MDPQELFFDLQNAFLGLFKSFLCLLAFSLNDYTVRLVFLHGLDYVIDFDKLSFHCSKHTFHVIFDLRNYFRLDNSLVDFRIHIREVVQRMLEQSNLNHELICIFHHFNSKICELLFYFIDLFKISVKYTLQCRHGG